MDRHASVDALAASVNSNVDTSGASVNDIASDPAVVLQPVTITPCEDWICDCRAEQLFAKITFERYFETTTDTIDQENVLSALSIEASVQHHIKLFGNNHWITAITKFNSVESLFELSMHAGSPEAAELAFRYSLEYFEWARVAVGDARLYATAALRTITELRPHLQW